MRTVGRWLLAGLMALLALAGTVFLIVFLLFRFNEEWRVHAVDGLLERTTGWQWSLGTVDFGWNTVQASDVFVMQYGAGVEFASLQMELATSSLLKRDPIWIRSGTADRCLIDLSTLPPASLGLTRQQLAEIPSMESAVFVVERMVMLALERAQTAGVRIEIRDLALTGTILFPARRSLEFDLIVRSGSTARPADSHLDVSRAVLR